MQKAIKNEQNEKNHLYSNILDIDRKRRLSRKRKPRDKYNLIEKKKEIMYTTACYPIRAGTDQVL